MITAGLVQEHPDRFTAALPMCGVLGGGVGTWNGALDAAFSFNTVLDGGVLQCGHITNPTQNFITAEGVLAAAHATAQGRARLALVAALGDLPGWFDPTSPEPARTDYASQQANRTTLTPPFVSTTGNGICSLQAATSPPSRSILKTIVQRWVSFSPATNSSIARAWHS